MGGGRRGRVVGRRRGEEEAAADMRAPPYGWLCLFPSPYPVLLTPLSTIGVLHTPLSIYPYPETHKFSKWPQREQNTWLKFGRRQHVLKSQWVASSRPALALGKTVCAQLLGELATRGESLVPMPGNNQPQRGIHSWSSWNTCCCLFGDARCTCPSQSL